MVGGGLGAFIGPVHRMAARLDDRWELVAGALSSDPARARASGAALHLAADRAYDDFAAMAAAERDREDGIDLAVIVTPNHLHHAAATAFLDAGIHVLCDKPMTTTLDDAIDLVGRVDRSGLVFIVSYNYSGYPMVRQARELVAAGEIGEVRVVQVEYAQEWLAEPIERGGHKQASWRTDPHRAGPAGCLGDIATHAFHLAEFVTRDAVAELAADVSTAVAGRRLDDNAQLLLRYASGARGALWASQVAQGSSNALRLRVFGSRGALEWHQESPNELRLAKLGQPTHLLTRSSAGLTGSVTTHGGRLPAGHTEGFVEALAALYADTANLIGSRLGWHPPSADTALLPSVRDGARSVAFVAAALSSFRQNSAWTPLREIPLPIMSDHRARGSALRARPGRNTPPSRAPSR
jgi:predicted dehydrogenase